MGKKHDYLIRKYSKPKNVDFIDEYIKQIIPEQSLYDTFGIDSMKTPDFIYVGDENLYVGEVKGWNSGKNETLALKQVGMYYLILKDNDIETIPFIILDNYKKVFF